MMEIILPKPTAYQKEVIDFLKDGYNSGKTACVKSVRQSGKSFMSMLILLMYALGKKCRSIYVAPTLQQSTMTFKAIVNALEYTNIIKNTNGATFAIEFMNGSDILFRSTGQGTSLRGLTASGILVLDECAFLKDEDINVILPFANANNAPILAISTPFARQGYFFNLYTQGITKPTELVKAFDWSTHPETSRFLTPERKEFYKKTMAKHLYNTEILGQFLADDGLLFQNIQDAVLDYKPVIDEVYIGIDFGTGNGGDYTVMSVMNKNSEQVNIYSTNKLSPMKQVEWLAELINQYPKVNKILAEVNSIGNVYIDALQSKIKHKITKWVTNNSSKKDLVTQLQLALENKTVKIQNNEELITELGAYEMQITKSGAITFNGSTGTHDDMVIATMLSYYAIHSNKGTYALKF